MIIDAIQKLAPDAEVSVNAEDINQITWLDGNPLNITKEQIQEKLVELQAEWDSQEYARKRQAEYPSISELVVAMYDDQDKSALINKRAAIKKKYPKG